MTFGSAHYTNATLDPRLRGDDASVSNRGPLRGPLLDGMRHILSIIAWPKPEQETCFAPCIKRAKS